MSVHTSCAVLSGSLKRSSTAGNVAGTFSFFRRYNTCAIQPVMSAQAVFCQCVCNPFPSGSTINVARFCMSPVSWSVPRRISSSGLKATLCVELAGSNRKMRLLPRAAGRQLVNLAFEVGDNRAMRPCEHGRHNQTDAFAAARRRVTQNMLRSIVAKV